MAAHILQSHSSVRSRVLWFSNRASIVSIPSFYASSFVVMLLCVIFRRPDAQAIVPLDRRQQDELVVVHNRQRSALTPKPCQPLPVLGWDSILAEAAVDFAQRCRQQLDSTVRAKVEEVARLRMVEGPRAEDTIGQSISVQLSTPGRLNLTELIRSSFQTGRHQYNFETAQCNQSIGGNGPSLACLQYLYMTQESVFSVGCALATCNTVTFDDGTQLTASAGTNIFLLNCLYGPVPNRDVSETQPFRATCVDISPLPTVTTPTATAVVTISSTISEPTGDGRGQTDSVTTPSPSLRPFTSDGVEFTSKNTPSILSTQPATGAVPSTTSSSAPVSSPPCNPESATCQLSESKSSISADFGSFSDSDVEEESDEDVSASASRRSSKSGSSKS